ncbi:putative relative of glutathione S-transferase MAPEG superfamily [Stanieria cyanosphaera PCC 7437]|uniref:Relative of glutathione S-transferase MAPEG superfamily n=1 Tax=Stanieria cyanosphaera (strain ATCC 29371 / PCC 7437) TaxID=111780 RepID=K9XTN8_STAC7|nr:MAPEG family protein [Stanieria cyanosphaera]AFZ35429.1 putative relative of glutathione S-transferase MAPEG superfamily [Stanieria cyanosphaera PCC 7437]
MFIPISTLFIGLNGFIALILSFIVVVERARTRIWHGESKAEVVNQPNYLENPNQWAVFVESYTQKFLLTKTADDGILQRKIRAYGNFTEYVPLGLLFVLTLELMHSSPYLLWLIGSALTIGRVAHAWGLIATYGPSPRRAIGFCLTSFVYAVGAVACVYYGITKLL